MNGYQLAAQLGKDQDVLDIACGVGYGAFLLAQQARTIIGIDASFEVIEHATRTYVRSNLAFHQGYCAAIPLATNSVDLVVSYETLEHIFEQEQFLRECRRVLRPDGVLLISTPNAPIYNRFRSTPNPFHVHELTTAEFKAALLNHFPNVTIGDQYLGYGSHIFFPHAAHVSHTILGNHPQTEPNISSPDAMYHVATATSGTHLGAPHSYCTAPISLSEEYRHLASHVERLRYHPLDPEGRQLTLDALRHDLARSQRRVKALEERLSWRITTPLRLISSFIQFTLLR